MANVNITMRMDEQTKHDADVLFNSLGMNMSTAFNIFVKQALREGAIPFKVTLGDNYNDETKVAMLEAIAMERDPNSKRYGNVKEALRALKDE